MTIQKISAKIPAVVQVAIATSEALDAPPFEPTITSILYPGTGKAHAPILVRAGHFDVGVTEIIAELGEAGFTVFLSFEDMADYSRFRQLWIKAAEKGS